ncbi:DUF2933 domain-containing protein [Legionella anisa]|uniref:DUF2933 domain-containing protein n=2 Tax=Legionella anisa TaxID=28082 RepID=A0AAX0WZU8_9GAMM|nr:hypothetical protein Lani_2922 [Legionella anisa]MBN5937665.1 DUF2933 domain-containing protein [Legionella anisa]PNL73977.1 DUF2933 domain-containing protein [Legionella anisa]UAK81547.1 DUF2933 domain-containing protein [Legionella anisa]
MSQDREHLITQHNTNHEKSWWLSLRGFVIFIVLIAIGYYLFEKHRAHLFNVLPLVLLLLCPLMHFFMHGTHHHHHNEKSQEEKD